MSPIADQTFVLSRWDRNETRIAELLALIQDLERKLKLAKSDATRDLGRSALSTGRHMLGLHLEIRENLNLMKEELGLA